MITLDRCPACDSAKIRRSYSGETTREGDTKSWSVDVCADCTHGFINPQPSWEELAPYYPATYLPYDPTLQEAESDEQIVAKALESGEYRHVRVKPGDRLLDVGCGGGFFVRIAKKLGAVVEGVEPSPVAAERARALGLDVFTGTLETYATQFPEKRFDIITSNHVVEHVPEPVETLATMAKLLAPDGFIWIAVPNAGCWFCQTLKARWHSTDLPLHLMQFTLESMARAAKRAGLAVVSEVTYSLPGAVAGSLRQILRHKYFVPARLSLRIGAIDRSIGPRLGRKLDEERRGEAILITLKHP